MANDIEITVYSKPDSQCFACKKTKEKLYAAGHEPTVIDVTEDAEALEKVKEMGFLQVPVVIISQPIIDPAGNEIYQWFGLRPDFLSNL